MEAQMNPNCLIILFCTFLIVITAVDIYSQSASNAEAKIESAVSAAPATITNNATVKDWDGNVLREGSNGWTCYPEMPNARAENPMCLDKQWINWLEAYMNQSEPDITEIGMGYMLIGGEPNSNLDPFATGPTADNQWMDEVKPHVMMLFPDEQMYDGISTDPENGGPWVMFPETPFVHVMMPVDD